MRKKTYEKWPYCRISRLSVLLAAVFLMAAVLAPGAAMADTTLLWQTKKTEPLAKDVQLTRIERLTPDGWLNIYLTEADISNKDIRVDTLLPSIITEKTTLKGMLEKKGAVAGVNGDFFIFDKVLTPVGPVVSSSRFIASPIGGDSLSAVSMDEDKQLYFKNWTYDGKIVAPNGMKMAIDRINKMNDGTKLSVYNRFYNEKSPQSFLKIPTLTEMLVEDDKVSEIRMGGAAFTIPEDGYVVMGREAAGQFLLDNFQPGDKVQTDFATLPDWKDYVFAMGTGAKILENGKTASFSDKITGDNPRTAIGISKDGKKLFLMVVDGRTWKSKGVTQSELAALLAEYGAWTAANLDGGGSSEMAVRDLFGGNSKIVNAPSDGNERNIPIGLGIFSDAKPTGTPGEIILSGVPPYLAPGQKHALSAVILDTAGQPMQVAAESMRWSSSGNIGSFRQNVFTAGNSGIGTITASYGSVQTTARIRVIGTPIRIFTGKEEYTLSPGEKIDFGVALMDSEGYRASIYPGEYSYNILGGIGKLNQDGFTAANSGSGAVEVRYGKVFKRFLVRVGSSGSTPVWREDLRMKAESSYIDDPSRTESIPAGSGFSFAFLGGPPAAATSETAIAYEEKLATLKSSGLKATILAEMSSQGTPWSPYFSGAVKTYNGRPSTWNMENSQFIFLDNRNGGLLAANNRQYLYLNDELAKTAAKNIFIVLPNEFDKFSTDREKCLYLDLLADYKARNGNNLWVLSGNSSVSRWYLDRGVHYISLPDWDAAIINVNNSNVTYQIIN